MSDDLHRDSATSGHADGPPQASPRLLTWWFGLMAIGGISLGLYADTHPFGRGVFAHPVAVFAAGVLAGLTTLRVLYARPLVRVISGRCLVAGALIAVVCFVLGRWFNATLMHLS